MLSALVLSGLNRTEVWGLEPSFCNPNPQTVSSYPQDVGVKTGRQETWLLGVLQSDSITSLPSSSWVPIREENVPALVYQIFLIFASGTHFFFFPLSSLLPVTISLLHPPRLTGYSSSSPGHLWASCHLGKSSIFFHSCLFTVWSSLCNQRDPGPNLIRASHSPAQNPPWLSITPGINADSLAGL